MKSKRQKYPKKIRSITQLDKFEEFEDSQKRTPKKMKYRDEE